MTDDISLRQPRLSVSSWSLHKTLGRPSFYGVDDRDAMPTETHNQGQLTLLELPTAISDFGINTLEICHFHLPSLEPEYLADLRRALADAGVELFSLLVDDGDITHPHTGERDTVWIAGWIEVAAALGARCMRVIAGKQAPTPASLQLSAQRLGMLADAAADAGVRLMTENWFGLTCAPEAVITLLTRLDGRVGLCLDFGNWQGESKYAGFQAIANMADSCHTKAQFDEAGHIDGEDYRRCLEITRAAGFQGPYTLIFENEKPAEWQGLALERAMVEPFVGDDRGRQK